MARLPNSFRERNRTTKAFREQYQALPAEIQVFVRKTAELFDADPAHTSLRHHELKDVKKGRHTLGSFSVSITMQYRAIYFKNEDDINIWYWVGTHAEYKTFTGSKK